MSNLTYHPAKPDDAALCIKIRGMTRENAFSEEELKELGVTAESWSTGIADGSCPGFIACASGDMIGYCFGDRDTGEIVVLSVLPEYEGQGVGKTLLGMMVEKLKKQGFHRLFLACSSDPNVRSYSFYRYLGWSPTGEKDQFGDEILEIQLKND